VGLSLSCSQHPRRFFLICFWGFVLVGFHNWCTVFAVLTILDAGSVATTTTLHIILG